MLNNYKPTKKNNRTTRLDEFQPIPIRQQRGIQVPNFENNASPVYIREKRKDYRKIWVLVIVLVAIYFFAPFRTNIFLLGTDYLPPRDLISRTDTNILITINPLKPYIGMLSIPRDLWVEIPGVGINRINTAYFFAEAAQPGSGPLSSIKTINKNFGITLKYYFVIKMEGFINVTDALGGVDVNLPTSVGGLTAGPHHLDGKQALAFVRERHNADDFSRMKQGQLFIKAFITKLFSFPVGWLKIPIVLYGTLKVIDTNIPLWLVPRLGLAVLRAGTNGIDNRIITREMVTSFTTIDGAQVLAPNWDAINPVLLEMFGQ